MARSHTIWRFSIGFFISKVRGWSYSDTAATAEIAGTWGTVRHGNEDLFITKVPTAETDGPFVSQLECSLFIFISDCKEGQVT